MRKIKVAICRGTTCSGCDVAVLDLHERLLLLAEKINIVFAPTIMDAKYRDVEKMQDNEIDICLYHGAVRDSENKHMAELLRRKSRILIAFGSCACFGGLFGLINTATTEEIMEEVYLKTESTCNPHNTTPLTEYTDRRGHKLTLPQLYDDVVALDEVVAVDYFIPLCPPMPDQLMEALEALLSEKQPPRGTVFASEKTLCSECKRKKSVLRKIERIRRPHETVIDPEKCFLEQGLICMGPATRAGCKTICIKANVPCRGCAGPTKATVDQGANILGLIATLYGIPEESLTEEEVKETMKQIKDPLGTFYRFTLAKSLLRRRRKTTTPP